MPCRRSIVQGGYLSRLFVHHACVTARLRSITFGSMLCGRSKDVTRRFKNFRKPLIQTNRHHSFHRNSGDSDYGKILKLSIKCERLIVPEVSILNLAVLAFLVIELRSCHIKGCHSSTWVCFPRIMLTNAVTSATVTEPSVFTSAMIVVSLFGSSLPKMIFKMLSASALVTLPSVLTSPRAAGITSNSLSGLADLVVVEVVE